MEEYYTELYKHRYSKGRLIALIQNIDTTEVEKIEIDTTIQVGFKSHAAKMMRAIADCLLSNKKYCRVTCFHVKYDDGIELVFTSSFYNKNA